MVTGTREALITPKGLLITPTRTTAHDPRITVRPIHTIARALRITVHITVRDRLIIAPTAHHTTVPLTIGRERRIVPT
jgi:hypothetical protein